MGLKQLDLRNTAVTDAGIASLIALSTLEQVDLRGTAVTEDGCRRLTNALPDCEVVR